VNEGGIPGRRWLDASGRPSARQDWREEVRRDQDRQDPASRTSLPGPGRDPAWWKVYVAREAGKISVGDKMAGPSRETRGIIARRHRLPEEGTWPFPGPDGSPVDIVPSNPPGALAVAYETWGQNPRDPPRAGAGHHPGLRGPRTPVFQGARRDGDRAVACSGLGRPSHGRPRVCRLATPFPPEGLGPPRGTVRAHRRRSLGRPPRPRNGGRGPTSARGGGSGLLAKPGGLAQGKLGDVHHQFVDFLARPPAKELAEAPASNLRRGGAGVPPGPGWKAEDPAEGRRQGSASRRGPQGE